MFYNNSEVEFPNWWDDLGSKSELTDDGANPDGPGNGTEGLYEREDVPGSENDSPAGHAGGDRVGEKSDVIGAGYSSSKRYDDEVLSAVWEYAEVVPGNDADLWRKDEFGNWIYRFDFGKRNSEFGWEVFDPGVGRHHQGIYAMRPMQWQSYLRAYDFLGA